jgi:hypothetical protein
VALVVVRFEPSSPFVSTCEGQKLAVISHKQPPYQALLLSHRAILRRLDMTLHPLPSKAPSRTHGHRLTPRLQAPAIWLLRPTPARKTLHIQKRGCWGCLQGAGPPIKLLRPHLPHRAPRNLDKQDQARLPARAHTPPPPRRSRRRMWGRRRSCCAAPPAIRAHAQPG